MKFKLPAIAALALFALSQSAWAQPPYEPPASIARPVAMSINDVQLQPGGVLQGRTIDASGSPLVTADVRIAQSGAILAETKSNEAGAFTFAGLRGGVYEIETPQGKSLYRLWAPNTAPPAAANLAVVSPGTLIVRGQYQRGWFGHLWEHGKFYLTDPIVAGGIITAAVAIPIIINNTGDDDDSSS